MVKNPNIVHFNNQVRDLGIEPDDPRISVRQLFRAYSEGRKPELSKILINTDQPEFESDDMEVAVTL